MGVDLPEKPWFPITEAAQLAGCCRQTMYNWIECGDVEVTGHKYFLRVSRLSLLKKLSNLSNPSV
jgi:hypothetical protein